MIVNSLMCVNFEIKITLPRGSNEHIEGAWFASGLLGGLGTLFVLFVALWRGEIARCVAKPPTVGTVKSRSMSLRITGPTVLATVSG